MKAREVLAELEALGSEQCRKIYGRHGVRGPAYGVSYANLGKLQKKIACDKGLAEELWSSGNHDARVLATMVADPEKVTQKRLEAWARELDNYVLTDALSTLSGRSPAARKLALKWIASKGEWTSSAGWNVLARLASDCDDPSDAELERYLERIERGIHSAPNRTRYSMNNALICIGMRSAALERRAIAAAKRIGAVEVDHGETGCKTPDAASYIPKAAAYARKRREKAKPRAGKAARAAKART